MIGYYLSNIYPSWILAIRLRSLSVSPVDSLCLDLRTIGIDNVTKSLADFDFLPWMDGEFERLGGFEDEDDSASQAEATHFLCGGKRLAVEDGRGG